MELDFSFLPDDAALLDYLPGILPQAGMSSNFLSYYDFPPDRSVTMKSYSRQEFWVLVMRCITLIQSLGGVRGMKLVHYLSGNIMEDLVLRTASIFIGTIPVTINWQADIMCQINYKIVATEAKIIVVDAQTPNLPELRAQYPLHQFLNVDEIHSSNPIDEKSLESFLRSSDVVRVTDIRCIIFTSGTTGHPKGVELSYMNYRTNRNTFEYFLGFTDPKTIFVPIVVNPMHHTNSTSITDWALRRPGSHLHLLERYSTQYWALVASISTNKSLQDISTLTVESQAVAALDIAYVECRKIVCPLVSRHIDFLESLADAGTLGLSAIVLRECLSRAVLLIGSAPVGPSTTKRLLKYANRLPTGELRNLPCTVIVTPNVISNLKSLLPNLTVIVRFGSTETTLQISGIPLYLSVEETMEAFQKGWKHCWQGESCQGFYIGRQHDGFTEVRVVLSIRSDDANYLVSCSEGQPGYLITKGGHVMRGYVGKADLTDQAVTADGWYLQLGDIGFTLGPNRDLYWQSRDSQMLIRGGSNYAFEQVNAELAAFIESHFGLVRSTFNVAVCGLRVKSEHEDECCVMIELLGEESQGLSSIIQSTFLEAAKRAVSKGSKPDRMALGLIPMVLSKGIVSVPELIKYWKLQ